MRIIRVCCGLLAALALSCGPSVYTAKTALERNEVDEAIRVLEQLKEKNPDNEEVRMELVDAYYRKSRSALDAGNQAEYAEMLGRAEDELLAAVAKWPESPTPHTWYGIIRAYQGQLDPSIDSFRNALKLSKRSAQRQRYMVSPTVYTNLAHVYVYADRVGDARRYVSHGRKRGAPLSEVERIELLAAWKSGDMVEARDIFDMAAGLTPGFAETWDGAPLPEPMKTFEDFADVCCSNPSCGPYMEGACKRMELNVTHRDLEAETVRKQLELEMKRRRELKKIYDRRKDLEIKVEDPTTD